MKEEIKIPRQKYILSTDETCPFCNVKDWRPEIMISNPPKVKCNNCEENVVLYSI